MSATTTRFGACKERAPLSKECSKLLEKGIPWADYYSYKNFQKSKYTSAYEQDGFNRYRAFQKMIEDCVCDTLPTYIADNIKNNLEKAEKGCEREFEVKLKTLE